MTTYFFILSPAPDVMALKDIELIRMRLDCLLSESPKSQYSLSGLAGTLQGQPPCAQDAIEVGDLLLKARDLSFPGKSSSGYSLLHTCRCTFCVGDIASWYQLAIRLDPNNPIPYNRLAREFWWNRDEFSTAALRMLKSEEYSETLFKQAFADYL